MNDPVSSRRARGVLFAAALASGASLSAWAQAEIANPYDHAEQQTADSKEKAARISAAENEPTVPIVIYQISDVHGSLEAFKGDAVRHIPPSGGAASLATLLKERKPDLFIDSGDWFSGTMLGDRTKGDATLAIFEALHLDLSEIGNHDYDLGEDNAARLVAKASFPVLGSNVGGIPGLRKTLIKDVKGVKIGFFGLLTTEMSNGLATPNNVANSSFADEAETAQKMVEELRRQGAQIVIAVTHMGVKKYGSFKASDIAFDDVELANRVNGIDLILGGHTHVKMDPPLPEGDPSVKLRPGVHIFQPGAHLAGAYRIVLNVAPKTGEIKSIDAHLIPLDPARYAPDPETLRLVEAYAKPVEEDARRPIGSAAVALSQNSTGEGLIYNWVTDAFQRYGKTDLAIVNTFGIRGGLPQGALTYGDLYGMMSFPNQMASMTLTGKELWKTVECSVPRSPGEAIMLRFSAALRVEYDPNTTPEQQGQLKALCETHAPGAPVAIHVKSLTVDGKAVPADESRTYTVETMDYVAMSEMKIKRGVDVGSLSVASVLARDMMADEIRATSPIAAKLDGRVRAAGSP